MSLNKIGCTASIIGNKSETVAGHVMTHGDTVGGPVLSKDAHKTWAHVSVVYCNWTLLATLEVATWCVLLVESWFD